MMSREFVLQGLLDLHPQATYLEIGVHSGHTFHPLRAARKVAVDPNFRFDLPVPAVTHEVEYHPVASDEYFGTLIERGRKFDVIYLDGLHTSQQTLRDLLNAVEHLKDDGVIIVDDVVPTSYAASLPEIDDFIFARTRIPIEAPHEAWMGDVYKLVYFVEAFMQAFEYGVVEENHGQMVLWRKRRPAVSHPARTLEWISRMDLITMHRNPEDLRRRPYAEILQAYRSALEEGRTASA